MHDLMAKQKTGTIFGIKNYYLQKNHVETRIVNRFLK